MPDPLGMPSAAGRRDAAPLLGRIARRIAGARGGSASDFGLDARLLLGLAMGNDAGVFPHERVDLTGGDLDRLEALVDRRARGEPVSRLRGWREFRSLRFAINPATLDPRPDSETVVEAATGWLAGRRRAGGGGPRVLDLGTGSGCLLLSVLHDRPEAVGLGVDNSGAAVGCARRNGDALGLADRAEFLCASWDGGLGGRYDAILSNPPYIPEGDMAGLAPEVRDHDPEGALAAGPDGLSAWREVLPAIARRLDPDGRAFVEIGKGQGKAVAAIASDAGLRRVDLVPDLAGVGRCLVLRHRDARRGNGPRAGNG